MLDKLGVFMIWVLGLFIAVGPWINHLVYCFQEKEYVLLIAGAIIAPVGWIHGLGLWFGFW